MNNTLPFNYNFGLYRRNNFGQPCVWYARPFDDNSIEIFHGIVGKTITQEIIITHRNVRDEISSRIKAKEKVGYKHIWEIKDNTSSPVEGELLTYLLAYLPEYRTTADGSLLPMLAKTYDNANNKLFNKVNSYIGQWKINGLRCFISAERSNNIFRPIRLKFQSREGTYWNSLSYLEDYLLTMLDDNLLNRMVDENYILDGELYLPGYTINQINHFVKDSTCPENKLIQYWCYDIAIEDTIQYNRTEYLASIGKNNNLDIKSKLDHLSNIERFVILPYCMILNENMAIQRRNEFIDLGFEGLIMRNPKVEYQFGKRNLSMIKYKKSTDGKFKIVDIKPEGIKRPDIPIFVCQNDINNSLFECHVGGVHEYQKRILKEKDNFIGRYMYVEYGERSGVEQVPFHIKTTYII